MYRPLREQARSHTGSSVGKKLVFGTDPSVGAKLARDSGVSACLDVGCAAVIASRLAPTLDLQWARNLCSAQIPCGSELARDSGGSACLDAGCTGLFASKLAPTLDLQRARNLCSAQIPLWEQSLLAIAACLLAWMLDVPPSSRAGSLPHWIFSGQETCVRHRSLCGSKACSRWRWVSLPGCWMYRRHREQARSHTGSSVGKKLVFGADPSVGAKLARDGWGVECTGAIAGKPCSHMGSWR
ncbi:hypothetical protein J3D49_001756 [Pseudomonas kilonensis]|nr:hypothetical protein [Pseudomonas kilonensis]